MIRFLVSSLQRAVLLADGLVFIDHWFPCRASPGITGPAGDAATEWRRLTVLQLKPKTEADLWGWKLPHADTWERHCHLLVGLILWVLVEMLCEERKMLNVQTRRRIRQAVDKLNLLSDGKVEALWVKSFKTTGAEAARGYKLKTPSNEKHHQRTIKKPS